MKRISTKWLIIGVILLTAGLFGWSTLLQKNNPNVIAKNGVHWHPQLHIYVDDVEQVIPGDVGRIGVERSMHTHYEDVKKGVIHIEKNGVVYLKDIQLKQFLQNWGKTMNSFGTLERMTVNGKPSTADEDYAMHDGDTIKLYFASPLPSTESTSSTEVVQ